MGKVSLSEREREALQATTRSQKAPVAQVKRARLILMLAEGVNTAAIKRELGCDSRYLSRWSERFQKERLSGMYGRHPGRAPKQPVAKLEARILNRTLRHQPADGSTHWSSRKLAAELGDVSFATVQRVWRKHGVRPHRLKRHTISNDPDFESKAADVLGLYLNPPAHAVVFCVDEKTAIQALDRRDRRLPLSPGRAESHGFEYKRNGTLSLFAAFNSGTGEVIGKTAARHTSEQFVAFLADVVAGQASDQEIHVICDNVSSHKTGRVADFLAEHSNVHLHYTPTYSSWMNQVENWFSRIQRDVIARGVFTSTKDLDRKLMRYIRFYNKQAKPLKWTFADPSRRIR
jgi:transposase/transposase-like protein